MRLQEAHFAVEAVVLQLITGGRSTYMEQYKITETTVIITMIVQEVRSAVEAVVLELVTGGRSTPDVKRALLAAPGMLAAFFRRKDVNELLLPLLITCLNSPGALFFGCQRSSSVLRQRFLTLT